MGPLTLPTRDGGFDYKGFRSENQEAVKGAESLFVNYWENSYEKPHEQFMKLLSMRKKG